MKTLEVLNVNKLFITKSYLFFKIIFRIQIIDAVLAKANF